jgi:hypothetical protein
MPGEGGGNGRGGRKMSYKEQLQKRHEIESEIRKRAYDRGKDPDQAVKEYFGEEDEEDEEEEEVGLRTHHPPPKKSRGNPRSRDFMVGGQEDEGFLDINDPSADNEYSSLGDRTEEEPDVPRLSRRKRMKGEVDIRDVAAKMAAERNDMVGRE